MNLQSIALPPAHAPFFELDLRAYAPPKDSDDTVTQLRGDLAGQRLLLVHDETASGARQWARGLARELSSQVDLPVLEWQGFVDEASDALDLYALFAADGGIDALTAPAIFILPDVQQTALADWLFSLQPVLARRNQYVLLCTALPQSCWPLTENEIETFWRSPRGSETMANGGSCGGKTTAQFAAPINVAGLYQGLDRKEQLCLVGLCLCGELRDDHFFTAMARIIDEAWPALRTSVGMLDYADLARLAPLLRYVEMPSGYTKIEHRTGEQRRQLLALIRRSRWHHLRVAVPVWGSLLEAWLAAENEHNAEYAYIARAATHALRDLAHQSTGVVADLLWRLAASESPPVRTVAARVLAGDSPYESEQRDLYRLLEMWVSQRLPDERSSSTESESAEQRVRQTAVHAVELVNGAVARCPDAPEVPAELQRVRALLQMADETQVPPESPVIPGPEAEPEPESEPTPPPPLRRAQDELLAMARDPDLHEEVVELVSNLGMGSGELQAVLRDWQDRAANERGSDWLPVAFVAAHSNFRRSLGADEFYGWLAAELSTARREQYETVAMLLPQNNYVYDLVLPNHLSRLSDLLLYLAQKPALRSDLADLFVHAYEKEAGAVQETLERWHASWLQRYDEDAAWAQANWDEVQHTVREICLRIDCQGWHIWGAASVDPAPLAEESPPVEETPAPAEGVPVVVIAATEAVGAEPVADEAEEPDQADELETELADLMGMVRYAERGDAERRQVIDRFLAAYRSDPVATQNRLNDLQMEALQKLNDDVNSSVEGLGLIGIIRDRIEEIEHNDAQ